MLWCVGAPESFIPYWQSTNNNIKVGVVLAVWLRILTILLPQVLKTFVPCIFFLMEKTTKETKISLCFDRIKISCMPISFNAIYLIALFCCRCVVPRMRVHLCWLFFFVFFYFPFQNYADPLRFISILLHADDARTLRQQWVTHVSCVSSFCVTNFFLCSIGNLLSFCFFFSFSF